MARYVGYGFDADCIANEELVRLFQTYDPANWACLVETANDNGEDISAVNVTDLICVDHKPVAEYVCDIINKAEQVKVGKEGVVEAYGEYIVFEGIAFVEDCPKRATYIRTREDFVRMIGKYFDTNLLVFADVYEDIDDWDEPSYWQELSMRETSIIEERKCKLKNNRHTKAL